MTRYAAFLRGVNVGGRIVKMADLRTCLEKAGLTGVTTLLQSGNVVFESDQPSAELKKMIEAVLTDTFGYPAKVQVVAMGDLQQIVADNPFADAPAEYHQYVIFFENGLEKDFTAEAADQDVKAGHKVAYWRVDKGQTLKSPVGKLLTKSKYRDFHTNRNVRTLLKVSLLDNKKLKM